MASVSEFLARFTADTSDLEKGTARADQALDKTSKSTTKATGDVSRATSSMATSVAGSAGAVAGSLAAGLGSGFLADALGWPTQFADAVGNMAENVIGDLAETAVQWGLETAAKTASTVATAVWSAVTATASGIATGLTAAVRALNVAFLANPFVLVATLLALLVAGLIYAWQNSETFRNIVTGAWSAVSGAAVAAWNWINNNAIQPMIRGFQWLIDKAGDLGSAIAGAFSGLGGVIAGAFNGALNAAKGALRNVFGWINDFVIGPANTIAGLVGQSIPYLPTGFAAGGYTGSGNPLAVAGIVHADEFVVRSSARRSFEAANPGFLSYVNRTGEAPSALGGPAGIGNTYTINVNVERGVAPAEVGRAIVDDIRAFERAAGASWRATA